MQAVCTAAYKKNVKWILMISEQKRNFEYNVLQFCYKMKICINLWDFLFPDLQLDSEEIKYDKVITPPPFAFPTDKANIIHVYISQTTKLLQSFMQVLISWFKTVLLGLHTQ